MTGDIGKLKSEVKKMAETAVRIDQLLTEAKEMARKLEQTSDDLTRIVTGGENSVS